MLRVRNSISSSDSDKEKIYLKDFKDKFGTEYFEPKEPVSTTLLPPKP